VFILSRPVGEATISMVTDFHQIEQGFFGGRLLAGPSASWR
jgi:hypothetical protein